MLKRVEKDYIKVSNTPATVEVEGGVTIHIDQYNNVTIDGYNNLNLNSKGDVNITGDNISIEAKTHLVHKAPRIDLNPVENEEYRKCVEDLKNARRT